MAKGPKWDEFSEFDGAGVMPSGVFPKGPDSLSNGDRLRLGYSTGVETDPASKPEPFQFVGGGAIAGTQAEADAVAKADRSRQQAIKKTGLDQYKNWPH